MGLINFTTSGPSQVSMNLGALPSNINLGGQGGYDSHDIDTNPLPGGGSYGLMGAQGAGGSNNILQFLNNLLQRVMGDQARYLDPAESGGGLPSASSAAKTMNDFQKEHGIGLLGVDQMDQIARTGYYTDPNGKTIQVPSEVQDAAKRMMANDGELFKRMESATDGNYDGLLGQGDYDEAIKDGTISGNGGSHGCHDCSVDVDYRSRGFLPSESSAAKTINDFQKQHGIGLLGVEQMDQIARTGYYTDPNGNTIQAPPEVQDAAQRMMANDAQLFRRMESATDGNYDGMLGQGDYDEAIKDGTISRNGGGHCASGVDSDYHHHGSGPSASSAAKTINDFQKQHGIGLLGVEQMDQIARTGYYTDPSGKTIQAPPEVQDAAQRMMANDGELFKRMESATDGNYDGMLGQGDYDEAIKDGTISGNGGSYGASGADVGYHSEDFLPSASSAAKTINDFQKQHGIGLLGVDQMDQIARTGYYTDPNGKTIQVPSEVQDAAKRMMANDGELFRRTESATDGNYDGLLGQGDYDEAIKDGTISRT